MRGLRLRSSLLSSLSLGLGIALPWLLPTPLRAQSAPQSAPTRVSDSAAVVGVAESLLRAISTRDTTLARRLMVPGAQLASIPDPAGPTTASRTQGDSAFMATLANGTQRYLERMWSPSVFLQGSLALVHAAYDFHLDGVFSHCGVDTFTLVRSRGEWRITHVAYTTQRAGCAPSPLGPPRD